VDEREHERAVELRKEAELASSFGFEARFVDCVPLMERPGVRFEGQAVFHPRRYLRGLLASVPGSGSYVCERTNVDEVRDDPLTVVANGHRVACDYVVVATHTPLRGKADASAATRLQTKLALYTTYAVAGTVRAGSLPVGAFWDTADPYLHVRINRVGDRHLVICGGEDHKTGQADDPVARYVRLEQKIRALVPDIELSHRWSGQVVETIDGLPFIGETSTRQFSATGYGGNGMSFGTVAAIMACDAATGRSNPWQALFDPGRTAITRRLWDYVRENKDYPYHFVRDRVIQAEGGPDLVLERGEGKIVDLGGRRVAAYRDESGAITRLSPVCTHMGCLVAWNAAERTWDCPCHGSRFEPDGQVLAGPAETRLENDVASGRDGR
jgi:glycine/D-amino acid oxidase-like deaminating enzyme